MTLESTNLPRDLHEEALYNAHFYCVNVFPGEYSHPFITATEQVLSDLPITDPYPELPQPTKPFTIYKDPQHGEEMDFYHHFVDPVAKIVKGNPSEAKALYQGEYRNQLGGVDINALATRYGQEPLSDEEVNALRMHARLSMQIAICERTQQDRKRKVMLLPDFTPNEYSAADAKFTEVISLAIMLQDTALLAEALRHSVNLYVSMAKVSQKGSEDRQNYLFHALANTISATALAKALNRGDTLWFGQGEVLALFSNKEIKALARAFSSEYSYVNKKALIASLKNFIMG